MDIRTFQPGDEDAQASIYNEAAAGLPKFKPATAAEIRRRVAARDFDPLTRFYAIENGRPIGYATFNVKGRVSFPWCRKGFEQAAEPLFQCVLDTMAMRGMPKAFAAYRGDWLTVLDFFTRNGFTVEREMVNFVLDAVDMPTMPALPSGTITPFEKTDFSSVLSLAPRVIRCLTAEELERYLFGNPYFPPSALFVLRGRGDRQLLGVGILIRNVEYGNPHAVDAAMPCFRLGAFGTEGMQVKRMNGLFSFLCRDEGQAGEIASDLMHHALLSLGDSDDVASLAAQVPSDAPHLLRFYQAIWRRQGSFPVLERDLQVRSASKG